MVRIDDYEFGEIEIEGKKYTDDVMIYSNRVISNWKRKEGHSLYEEDIEEILRNPPDILVIGKGTQNRLRLLPETRRALEDKGIIIEDKKTGRACKVFNDLVEEGKDVVAVLHLTC